MNKDKEQKYKEKARQAWRDQCSQDNEGGVDSVGFIAGYIAGRKAAEVDYGHMKTLLKELYEEWNEDCESSCNSYGHNENCKATFLAAAKRAMKEELNRSKEENEKMREMLKQAKPLVKGHFFDEDVDEWLVKYNELMGGEKV